MTPHEGPQTTLPELLAWLEPGPATPAGAISFAARNRSSGAGPQRSSGAGQLKLADNPDRSRYLRQPSTGQVMKAGSS